MKAIFEFEGNKYKIKVPKYLHYINDLTNKVCEADESFEISIEEAYDYLEDKLLNIFAKHMEMYGCELSLEHRIPTNKRERKFGSLIVVQTLN